MLFVCISFSLQTHAELVSREQGLQATLQEATTAFEQGDYARAAAAFEYLSSNYANEPAYDPLAPRLLPLHAHACLMSSDAPEAVRLFEQFLERYPDSDHQLPFVLFSLANAYQQQGAIEQAARTYQRYRVLAPDSPEALVSVMREADLYFAEGNIEQGITQLLAFAQLVSTPPTLQSLARLRAVQAAQAHGREIQAAEILIGAHWAITTMPDLAVLAFAGLQAGDAMVREGCYAEAILAYRMVPPKALLVRLQRDRLQQLEQIQRERLRGSALGVQADVFWKDYFTSIVEEVRAQLATLEQMEDYTPGWQLRLGDAFLRAGRPRAAALLFKHVSENGYIASEQRAEAHYLWILCANALNDWDKARVIAESFLENYPANPLAPQVLTLIANAYQQEGEFLDAAEVLSTLIENYPRHTMQPRWHFSRGYNFVMAEHYNVAHEDFALVIENYSDNRIAFRARLWQGLAYFFERNYAEALVVFDQLLKDTQGHALAPEVVYRRAATLYAMRDYAAARRALESLLAAFPGDQRAPAARVLLGDVLMGMGELGEAAEQFASVTPAADSLYPYAVFQRGKIYRATGNTDALIAHFSEYAAQDPAPPRVAEALYWIGWAHTQRSEPAKAFPQFLNAFQLHGNDLNAGETVSILRALHDLHCKSQSDAFTVAQPGAAAEVLLASTRFESWLLVQQQAALAANELTRYARLGLYLASVYRDDGHADRADVVLYGVLEKIPPAQLDAAGLSRLGWLLSESGFPSARDYFDAQLERYPSSVHAGTAFYGLAQLAVDEGNDADAEVWLKRFQDETPYHADAVAVALMRGRVLLRLNQPERARAVLEDLLAWKHARGRPHAEALLLIAECYAATNEPEKAIAYQQRVYTVYRAYPDLLARAYWQSAQGFRKLGDEPAAYRTLVEMTAIPRLAETPEFSEAVALRDVLAAEQANADPTAQALPVSEEEASL